MPRIKLVYVCKYRASGSYLSFFFFLERTVRENELWIRFLNTNKFQESVQLFPYNAIFSN